jgi:hypothetical protein
MMYKYDAPSELTINLNNFAINIMLLGSSESFFMLLLIIYRSPGAYKSENTYEHFNYNK